jgi:hypothetical protein
MKTYLQGMTVSDEKNANRQVKVWYGYPDIEIRAQDFPFLTIDLIDIRPARERQTAGVFTDNDYQGTVAPVSNRSYTYEVPVALDLTYQLTTYARHPRHDRGIITQLFQKFPNNRAHLPVPNDLGTATAYRHMFVDEFTKRDTVEGENGNKRLLRNIYTVRVMSELPPATAATVLKDIQTVNINHNTNNSWTQQTVPSGLQIV